MLYLLCQVNKITKKVDNNLIKSLYNGTKYVCNKRAQNLLFDLTGLKMLTKI